jgi:hypothetical protein
LLARIRITAKGGKMLKKGENYYSRKNGKLQIEDWIKRYRRMKKHLKKEQFLILESYRPSVRMGIKMAIKNERLSEYEHLGSVTECYEYELMIKFSYFIVTKNPPEYAVCRIAQKCAGRRKYTWYADMIRQKDACRVANEQYDCGYEGYTSGMVPVMGRQQNRNHLGNIPGPSNANPEDAFLAKERVLMIQKFPDYLRGLKKKRAPEYLKIYQLQMNGIVVGKEHSSILDIPEKKIASYKHQMISVLREFVGRSDFDAKKRIQIYRDQRGMKWPKKKSTAKERNALYRA